MFPPGTKGKRICFWCCPEEWFWGTNTGDILSLTLLCIQKIKVLNPRNRDCNMSRVIAAVSGEGENRNWVSSLPTSCSAMGPNLKHLRKFIKTRKRRRKNTMAQTFISIVFWIQSHCLFMDYFLFHSSVKILFSFSLPQITILFNSSPPPLFSLPP